MTTAPPKTASSLMAEPYSSSTAISAEESLGIQGEAEWSRLRRQLELAEGFWLAFLFTPSTRSAEILRRRLSRQLKASVRSLETLRPRSPQELPDLLQRLLTEDSLQTSGCVWLEAVRSSGDWKEAWTRLLHRSNERRDHLRRRLEGGLILVAPLDLKPLFRESAPDLWSIRNLVLEIPALGRRHASQLPSLSPKKLPAQRGAKHSPSGTRHSIPTGSGNVEQKRSEATGLLKKANSYLAQQRTADAVVAARSAVDLLSDNPPSNPSLGESLYWLARAEQADGDLGAAEEHIWQALHVQPEGNDRQRLLWLELASQVSQAVGDWEKARTACLESVRFARCRLEEETESPQAMRDLSVSLEKLGNVQRDTGDAAAALDAFQQSLKISYRLIEQFGESPQAMRDLLVSLNKLGDVQRNTGDAAAALDAFQWSLKISQRLIEQFGESPQALYDLVSSYFRLAQINQDQGSLKDGAGLAEKSEELMRNLIERFGQTPQWTGNLQACLRLSADILEGLGRTKEAAEKRQQVDEVGPRLAES